MASEWCVMKQLVQVLKPLEEETQELSAEQRVSCSKVIPLLNTILFKLWKYVVDKDKTQVPEMTMKPRYQRAEEAVTILGLKKPNKYLQV